MDRRVIRIATLAAATLFAAAAYSAIPLVNATCPGNIEVHADQGGPIYINGKEGRLKRFNDNYYEAHSEGVTILAFDQPGRHAGGVLHRKRRG